MNPIIDKIQKLMATAADSAATEAEARTAMAIAQRLMFAHRITEADINNHARAAAIAAGNVDAADMISAPIGPYEVRQDYWLALACAELCGLGLYVNTAFAGWTPAGRARRSKSVWGYGLATDIAVAVELFDWLRAKATGVHIEWCNQRGVTRRSVTGKNFLDGFALELLDKARAEKAARAKSEAVEQIQIGDGSMLPMVVAQVEAGLQRALAVKKKQLGLGKGRASSYVCDSGARAAGRAAGSKVNLSKQVLR